MAGTRMPLLELDLNEELTLFYCDNTDNQQEDTTTRLPDHIVDAVDRRFDLNFSPTDPDNGLQFDLNSEPFPEEDEPFQETEEVIDDGEVSQGVENQGNIKSLCNEERRAIYNMLLQKSMDGNLRKGVLPMVASLFSVSKRTVQRIWKQGKSTHNADVSHKKTRNCGRKRIPFDLERFREIPLNQRTTVDSIAVNMNMHKTTVWKFLKEGSIRRHSNAIKPLLTEENKRSRLQFCLSMLEQSSMPNDPIFKGMYNIVYIDEKWFYMTKKSKNYYLLPDEEDPIRSCKSKNFIAKVMFLVAVARPRFDAQGNEIFSGKLGLFPFVTQEPAKRTSCNRVAGTMETKALTSVKKEDIRSVLIEKVIPAIKEKWPRDDLRHPIFIQQDNARTHIAHNDEKFCQAAKEDGFDIRLMCQPANSPDLNVLDLGFFRAIQSLQYKESPETVDELLSAVVKSFEDFATIKSNFIFLTLQLCMIEIMKAKGSHKYKIPHVNKIMLQREGKLPTQINCDPLLVQEVQHYLSNN